MLETSAPVVRQRAHRAHPTSSSGAPAWAGLGVFLFCPATDHRHLLVGHVLPIAMHARSSASLPFRALSAPDPGARANPGRGTRRFRASRCHRLTPAA